MTRFAVSVLLALASLTAVAQGFTMPSAMTDEQLFKTEEGIRTADQMLMYQRVTGGWPKNINMSAALSARDAAAVLRDKEKTDDSTVDNNATTSQMSYLARAYRSTGVEKYRKGFLRGLDYLLSGQLENGGWPQFWPNPTGYQVNVTFNDNNMSNILTMFSAISARTAPYDGDLVSSELRGKVGKAFDKGIECILDAQIVKDGKPSVWCQQNDPVTLKPARGRTYELPSYCSAESVNLVKLLMTLPDPDKRVKAAVHGAMQWFDRYKITGYKVTRTFDGGRRNTVMVEDPSAAPMWARFYDLERCEPYVCDRDGLPRRRLEEIGRERRNGYSWFNSNASGLYELYAGWLKVNDPKYKSKISPEGKGGNETGAFMLFRKHEMDPKDFDLVVKPGESIQAAVDKAPAEHEGYFKILVRKGVYRQSVNIDKPRILLVGEDRAETRIELSEEDDAGGSGTVLNIGANGTDLIVSGFTLSNKFKADALDPSQPQSIQHRMTVMGRADRTVIINCTINSNGNDALALWAEGGNGMYYHADLEINCPGVDFICPRGWCYATRCRFYGDSRAMIWHDGRGDSSKKFVITNSDFDAASPTLLGRYHHDAAFYILHSEFSSNILDQNIHYAYSDKVLDPCPLGERMYWYGNYRVGGNSGWLDNNLEKAPGSPDHWECLAPWTFDGRWDPEKTLSELWDIIEY